MSQATTIITPPVSELEQSTGPFRRLCLTSSFQLEPELNSWKRWFALLGWEVETDWTGYNRWSLDLTDESSEWALSGEGCVRVVLFRMEDLFRDIQSHNPSGDGDFLAKWDERAAALLDQVTQAAGRLEMTLWIEAPTSSSWRHVEGFLERKRQLWEQLQEAAPNWHFILAEEQKECVWNPKWELSLQDEVAHLPYDSNGFFFLAGLATRRWICDRMPRPKVLVLDADNTLWDGVCGEQDPSELGLFPERLKLQELALRHESSGKLLCICSRNQEEDVWKVFDQRADLKLRRDHLVASRINWRSKAENIRSLAEELNLYPDSFVFVDDDPAQCAAVRQALPETLTLQLPADAQERMLFIELALALDLFQETDIDPAAENGKSRTAWYRQESKRRSVLRGKTETVECVSAEENLSEVRRKLGIRVAVKEIAESQTARVAELFQRTNQFNLGGPRRTLEELNQEWQGQPRRWMWGVEASDTFGDYGLVGVALARLDGEVAILESMLMSCRALGRGIEWDLVEAMINELRRSGVRVLKVVWRRTVKNVPARDFLKQWLEKNSVENVDLEQHGVFDLDLMQGNGGVTRRREDAKGDAGILDQVCVWVADFLGVEPVKVDREVSLFDQGLESLQALSLMEKLEEVVGSVPRTLIYTHPSLNALEEWISQSADHDELSSNKENRQLSQGDKNLNHNDKCLDVAIVGMAGRFGGADSLEEMWDRLKVGDCVVGKRPDGRPGPEWGGFLKDVAGFDPVPFQTAPAQAAEMDPAQRVLLELSLEAVERSGHTPASIGQRVGVFIGAEESGYGRLPGHETAETELADIAGRIAHQMHWTGPAMTVQTACASGMTAISVAIQSLQSGACDAALVGGVHLELDVHRVKRNSRRAAISETGQPKVYSREADGYVDAEGAGVILLRTLGDARQSGDQTLARIVGCVAGYAGSDVAWTAPNSEGMAERVERVLRDAVWDWSDLDYVEGAANGAPLTDMAELDVWRRLTQQSTKRQKESDSAVEARSVVIGSTKAHLGNTGAASVFAGLFRILLQIQKGKIAPQPGLCDSGVADIDETEKRVPFALTNHWDKENWVYPVQLVPWDRRSGSLPRKAMLHTFGQGGYGGALLVEEICDVKEGDGLGLMNQTASSQNLLAPEVALISADDAQRLKLLAGELSNAFSDRVSGADLRRALWTLRISRGTRKYRAAWVVRTMDDFLIGLKQLSQGESLSNGSVGELDPRVVSAFNADKDFKNYQESLAKSGQWNRLASLWALGAPVDWTAFDSPGDLRRVELPPTPMIRQRLWLSEFQSDTFGERSTSESGNNTVHQSETDPKASPIMEAFRNALGWTKADWNPEAAPTALGVDSILAMTLARRFEEAFQIELSASEILGASSMGELVESVESRSLEQNQVIRPLEAVSRWSEKKYPQVQPDQQNRWSPFPLTDIQLSYLVGRNPDYELGGVGCHNYWEFDAEDLDAARLNRAWNKLARRHDMLRAVFLKNGTQVVQQEVGDYQFPVTDLRNCNSDESQAALNSVRDRLSHQVHDPYTWPLFSIELVQLPDLKTTRICLSLDLLIFDALSIFRVLEQWMDLYDDLDAALPAPPEFQFRDYVLALEQTKRGEIYQRAENYWKQRAVTLPGGPELPTLVEASRIKNPTWIRNEFQLNAETWNKLKTAAGHRGLTEVGVLLTAVSEVLNQWSASDRYSLNLTLLNRLPVHPEIEQVIGDFTSTLLLEVNSSSGISIAERAQCIKHQLMADLEHRDFNGVQALREMAKRRPDERSQLKAPVVFTSLLGFDSALGRVPRFRSGLGTWVHAITQTPQVSLDIQAYEESGVLYVTWDSVEGLYPDGMIRDCADRMESWLSDLAEDPDRWEKPERIRNLPQRQAKERLQVNATEGPEPEALMCELFVRQALKTPDRVAVKDREGSWTYQQIYNDSLKLAQRLKDAGIQVGELVPVALEKGWRQVVAVLGIQISGAAYAPLDPATPEQRLKKLIHQMEARWATTEKESAAARIFQESGVNVLEIQSPDDDSECFQSSSEAPEYRQGLDDLAYVIFTSGSTGEPKGVMIDHRGAVNTIQNVNERFEVGAEDRTIALSALGFDLSVYDIFGPLAVGGCVCIPDPDQMGDPAYLQAWIQKSGVTIWNSAPMFLQLYVRGMQRSNSDVFSNIRLVLLSGDWIPMDLPGKSRQFKSQLEIVSLGGATEASIWSIWYPIEVDADLSGWNSIPYGYPMRNQTFHVLDSQMEPCPEWKTGELYIGGTGLARGYWRDQERTHSSFVTHPETGERLYRTGDLGRYRPGGVIEFLGRRDHQVKIGGFRIELGDIESNLLTHPDVSGCAVVIQEDRRGMKKLVCFWTAAGSVTDFQKVEVQLKQHLAERTPDYMQPHYWRRLDEMPLNQNDKLDRKRLTKMHFEEWSVSGNDKTSSQANHVSLCEERKLNGKSSFSILEQMQTPSDSANGSMENGSPEPGLILNKKERDQFRRNWHGRRRDLKGQTYRLNKSSQWDPRYLQWRSVRRFESQQIPQNSFENWLGALRMSVLNDARKFLYGSAGGLYPVQTYVYAVPDRIENIAGGIYYYDPEQHALVTIDTSARLDETPHFPTNRPIFQSSAFSLFFVAAMDAIQPLYGSASRDYCLIEAGQMAQLLTQAAPDYDLGVCGIGAMNFDKIRPHFKLGNQHELLYSMIGGGAADPVRSESQTPFADEPAKTPPLNSATLESVVEAPDSDSDLDLSPPSSTLEPKSVNGNPETDPMQALAELWQEALQVEGEIDPDRTFFDLGGDSFSVVDLSQLIQNRLGLECSVTDILNEPTLRRLSQRLWPEHIHGNGMAESSRENVQQETTINRNHRAQRRAAFRRRIRNEFT